MDLILKQLGELLLGSIPTIVFLLLLFVIYTFLVHRPLTAVLAERRSKTEGAVEKARADLAAAEARAAEYEQRLREARLVVYRAQDVRRTTLKVGARYPTTASPVTCSRASRLDLTSSRKDFGSISRSLRYISGMGVVGSAG